MSEWFGKKERVSLYGTRIGDDALIGDCETAALVGREELAKA